MPLDLTTRAGKGSPLTLVENDQNLTNIETLVNSIEVLVSDENVDTLKARVTVNESDIGNLETGQASNDTELANHETRITTNEAHVGSSSGNPHAVTGSEVGLSAVTNDAQLKRSAGDIGTFATKATPVDADVALIEDSAAANAKKKLTWANLKATLKTYLDTLYSTITHAAAHTDGTDDIQSATNAQKGVATAAQITSLEANVSKLAGVETAADVTDAVNVASSIHGVAGKTTPVNADEVGLIDSAASNVLKKLTWANLKATLATYFNTLYLGIAAKAANSSLLNGVADAEASTVSTIVKRNASGDINVRLVRSEYDSTNPTINYIMTQIDTVSNNYIRPSTVAQVAAALGGEVADGSISQAKLKTTTQSQSFDIPQISGHTFILTGGQYCFKETVKGETTNIAMPQRSAVTTGYTTRSSFVNLDDSNYRVAYVIHRYVQASGEVYWIFILRDKITKINIGISACADHPCFGNGGKPNLMPHPFLDDFDETIHELIVINPTKEQVREMQMKCLVASEDLPDRDLTEVIEAEYVVDDIVEPDWPSELITVKLPTDWEEKQIGEMIKPIQKIIPQPTYIRTAMLKLKE